MANIRVNVGSTNNVNVQVQDPNNLKLVVQNPASINAVVTQLPNNVIQLNRGIVGPVGPSGESNIGGYPIVISDANNRDVLMWMDGDWINVPQTEITDGGNF
jgi:hypothetical protein